MSAPPDAPVKPPVEVAEGDLVDYEEEEDTLPTTSKPVPVNGKEGTKKYATTP